MYARLKIGLFERMMHFVHEQLSALGEYLDEDDEEDSFQYIGRVCDAMYIPDGYSISEGTAFTPFAEGCNDDMLLATDRTPLCARSCDYYMENPGEIPCEWSSYDGICFGRTVFMDDAECVLHIWCMYQEDSGDWVRELLSIESAAQYALNGNYHYPITSVLRRCCQ